MIKLVSVNKGCGVVEAIVKGATGELNHFQYLKSFIHHIHL